jgi:FkbM family methyltransferase
MNKLDLTSNNAAADVQATSIRQAHLRDAARTRSMSKQYPYYGFVEVNIRGCEPFVMFSNNDDSVARDYYWNGADAFESTSLKLWTQLARQSPTILDIGSYTGVYSLAAAATSPAAKVHAFEALDRVYNRVLINKHANHLENIITHNAAVSDCNGTSVFNLFSGEGILVTGSSLLDKNSGGREVYETKLVQTVALDSMLDQFVRPRLVKIDVEGAETLVLKGAAQLIQQHRPDILIEVLSKSTVNDCCHLWNDVPYNYFSINDVTGEIVQHDQLTPATGMYDLNNLMTCKSLDELKEILND